MILVQKGEGYAIEKNNDMVFHIHKMANTASTNVTDSNDDWFYVRGSVNMPCGRSDRAESYAMKMPDLLDWVKYMAKMIELDSEPIEAIQIDFPFLPTAYISRSNFLLNLNEIAQTIRYSLDWLDTDEIGTMKGLRDDDSDSDSDSDSDYDFTSDSSSCSSSSSEESDDDSSSDYSEDDEEEELEEEEYTVHRHSCENRHNRILNYRGCDYDEEESAEESDDSDDSDYEPPSYVKEQVSKHTKYNEDGTLRSVTHRSYLNTDGKWVKGLWITARRP